MENFGQFLCDKSLAFAARIVKLAQYLQREQQEYIISKQIGRSGTSIGANLSEAQYGTSKKDFLAKCYIALKECNETTYWLDLLLKVEYITEKQHQSLSSDCSELKKLLVTITKTTKQNIDTDKDKDKQ
jgi:four helix bundle protein